MEQQFNAFNLGISWPQFGSVVRSNVDRLLDAKADLTPQQRIIIIDHLWANHPNKGISEKATQDAQQVYDWLMDSNVMDGVLSLPEGGTFPIDFLRHDHDRSVGGNVVLVRDISKHLCEMVDWIQMGGKVDRLTQRGLIVRGPPGDGKSFTSQYLVWYYVKKRVTVVYEDVSSGLVWVFRSDGLCRWFDGSANLGTAPELLDNKTILIHDAQASYSNREPVGACKATLVVFAPTNEKVMKYTSRGRMVSIGFVTPTAKEVYQANRVFGANMTMSELNGKIEKYGCHLQWLFNKTEAQVETTVKIAIDRLLSNVCSIDGVLLGVGFGVEKSGASAPTVLFSTAVKPEFEEAFFAIDESQIKSEAVAMSDAEAKSETESEGIVKEKRMAAMFRMYDAYNIMWSVVSEQVFALIMRKARDNGEDFANQFTKDMSNNRQLSTTVAPILEIQAPIVLSGGGQFRCRVPNKANTPATEKQEETMIDVSKTTLQNLVGGDNMVTDVETAMEQCTESGVFYNFCGQFRGVDAFSLPADVTKPAELFNFTGAAARPSVNFEALAALHKKGSADSANGEIFFNFVVPDEKFDLRTHEQPFGKGPFWLGPVWTSPRRCLMRNYRLSR